jgi:hypothetical protein
MHLAVGHDVVNEVTVRVGDGFIHKNEHTGQLVGLVECHQVPHGLIPGMKGLPGEKDAMGMFEPDGSLQH